MITDQRKGELMAALEYNVNRHLVKQAVIEKEINYLTVDPEEISFLHSTNNYFAVMLPEDK